MADDQLTKFGEAEMDGKGLVIRNASDLATLTRQITTSDLCPQQFRNKPNDAMIAILAGKAVGFAPIQALQSIAVINGRPSMYGDGPAALAYGAGQVDWIKEWFELDGEVVVPNYGGLNDYPDGLTACWQTKRKDASEPSPIARFSVGDAKMASLWGKKGPWSNYTRRMLILRARAWGLRDNYADALSGISQAEEWADLATQHERHDLSAKIGVPVIEAEIVEPEPEAEPEPESSAPPCSKCGKPLDHTTTNPLCSACQKEEGDDGELQ